MDIKHSPSGRVIKTLKGYTTFIPHPLPPPIEWTTALVNSLSRADHILGKLSREGHRLPNPHLLIRSFITREAVLSSKIEGTQATLGEVLANAAGVNLPSSSDDVREIQNYIKALDHGLKRLQEFPLSLRLIKEMHAILMEETRGSHATPGQYRRSQNWIGAPGCTLATAKYVPPSPEELMDSLGFFETFLYDRTLPPLIHIALCHYQFEAIHPFLDGNGRMGRLLITLLLIVHNLMPLPLLYLSAFFEATRDEYYRQLYNVSAQGSWHDWLSYFLNGTAVQAADALSRAERINALIATWRLDLAGASVHIHATLTHLAINPFLTINKIAKDCTIAFTTAQRIINKLENLGIITQVSDNKRDRTYCATKIFAILEEPAKLHIDELK